MAHPRRWIGFVGWQWIRTAGVILWALPWTSVGCLLGSLGLLSGGRAQRRGIVVEFCGGVITLMLRSLPLPGGASAITLGHTILGRDRKQLDRCRDHEQVHVRQYERWGFFFVPVYLGWSAWLWWHGRNAYYDNPFEVEAYKAVPEIPGTNYN